VNKSKRIGTAWETTVVRYLREWFRYAERRALAGSQDLGDITGIPGVVWELKDCVRHELAQWTDETETERTNANAQYGILVVKRRNKNVREAYAIMPLWQVVELLKDDDAS
jgi:hypothetical protein